MKRNLLQSYINKQMEKMTNFKIQKSDKTIGKFDYYHVITSKFSYVPPHKSDRAERMARVKANMDLSFLENTDKKCILMNKREGSDREGMVFNKINPVYSIDNSVKPNFFDWSTAQYNKRLLDKLVNFKEDFERGKIICYSLTHLILLILRSEKNRGTKNIYFPRS